MNPEEQTEEESILAFTVPDEALEHAQTQTSLLGIVRTPACARRLLIDLVSRSRPSA
jgi:hypothetical protein